MARVPSFPDREPQRRRRNTERVIKPEGRFQRDKTPRTVSDRSPNSVTRVRPEDKEPILPEMPYVPPA